MDRGELFGVIGPDGAGKTTLFRILTTLLLPGSGMAAVAGYDVVTDFREIRKIAGYMPGRFSLYQDLSVEENLAFFAAVFNSSVEENYSLIRDIYQHLEPFKKRRAGALSGGMKQKLALSCALIHKPEVLFLDEPTTGVDPVSRREFWEMLHRLRHQGITILVSTPYMEEARQCDRIALMQNGRFMQIETPEAITRGFSGPLWSVTGPKITALLADTRNHPQVQSCFAFGDCLHVTPQIAVGQTGNETGSSGQEREQSCPLTMENLRVYLETRGHPEVKIMEIPPGIEDCFMRLATDD